MVEFSRKSEGERESLSEEYIKLLLDQQGKRELKTWYEKLCKFSELLRLKPPKGMKRNLEEKIVFSRLNVTPTGVMSGSVLALILTGVSVLILSLFIDVTTLVFFGVVPLATFYLLYTYPSFQAEVVRIQAGDEAIRIILYMVIYLKLNPTFEGAINYAAARCEGPISDDIKNVMWFVEMGKYPTIEEALGFYMPKWGVWNEDFIRSLTLLRGVLKKPGKKEREDILKKSLSYLLGSTHKKMKGYVEEISSPIMLIHVMGLLLPAISLIMFPMISIFLAGELNAWHLIIGYTVILPLINLFFIYRALLKRPHAFMSPDISHHPELPPEDTYKVGKKTFIPIKPLVILVGLFIMFYGVLHLVNLYTSLARVPLGAKADLIKRESEMSLENLFSTFSITAGVAIGVFLYFYLRSVQRIRIRNEIKNIESEFRLGLFSLGNYLAGGYPIERSVRRTLDEYKRLGMEGRPVYKFFKRLYYNIKNLGLTFKEALFDEEHGIMKYYPSVLIDEIMKSLSDATRKSTVLSGEIAKTIASYLDSIESIENKIRELLEDTRSAIRLQAGFVVPMVLGAISSVAIFLLNALLILAKRLEEIEKAMGLGMLASGTSGVGNVLEVIVGDFSSVVPMTVLQAVVGIYTVEIVALLSILLSGVENGFDEVLRDYTIARNLIKAILIYGVVSFISLLIFRGLTGIISK